MSSKPLDDVRAILHEARGKAYAATNAAMVDWRIGGRIVEEEQGGAARAEYGSQFIRHLARSLGDEFGHGMSVANLWNFRQFYLTFPDAGKLYTLRRELSWSHWRLVMRFENEQACELTRVVLAEPGVDRSQQTPHSALLHASYNHP